MHARALDGHAADVNAARAGEAAAVDVLDVLDCGGGSDELVDRARCERAVDAAVDVCAVRHVAVNGRVDARPGDHAQHLARLVIAHEHGALAPGKRFIGRDAQARIKRERDGVPVGRIGAGDGVVARELLGKRLECAGADVAGVVADGLIAGLAHGGVLGVAARTAAREHDAAAVGECSGVEHAAGVDAAVGGKGRPLGAVFDVAHDVHADAAEHQHGDEQRAHGAAFDFVHACASFLLRDGSRTTKLAPRRVSAALM